MDSHLVTWQKSRPVAEESALAFNH